MKDKNEKKDVVVGIPDESNAAILPKQKSVHDMVEATCPKLEDGSFDVSGFDFVKAFAERGFKSLG